MERSREVAVERSRGAGRGSRRTAAEERATGEPAKVASHERGRRRQEGDPASASGCEAVRLGAGLLGRRRAGEPHLRLRFSLSSSAGL